MADGSDSKSSNEEINGKFGIDHARDLAKRIGDLLFDDSTADVILIVQGECLPAHRAILVSSSAYFRALLLGGMKESLQDEVVLTDVPLRAFKMLMGSIYTGQVRLGEVDEDPTLELLDIAHMYGFAKLEASLTKHLKKSLSQENVGKIYSQALHLKLKDLGEACYSFMSQEPDVTLKTEAFCDFSPAVICHVFSQDTFHAPEIEIFEAILRWRAKHQAEKDLERILKAVRLPLIDRKDLVTTVRRSGLISLELIVDAIEAQEFHAADRNFRGSLRSDVNLATADCGALMLIAKPCGEYRTARYFHEYDSKDMPPFTSKSPFPTAPGYTIALSEPFFINHIGFHINGANRCRYYVETSVDLENWVRVIDRTNTTQCGFQYRYFERRVARYVRLVLTTNLDEYEHEITFTKLRVDHTTAPLKLIQGNYAPGWISHDIGAGSIKLQLRQPLFVASMQMLLRSDESRAYLYYIETSPDDKTWTRVTEQTTDFRRSWQYITFKVRQVLYIKIVGTSATVGKVFSCSRFECPASFRDGDEAMIEPEVPEQLLELQLVPGK